MEQNTSCEANSRSAYKKFAVFYGTRLINYSVYKSPALVPLSEPDESIPHPQTLFA
jgi:hypothetical protein